jgi:hypothetical protein
MRIKVMWLLKIRSPQLLPTCRRTSTITCCHQYTAGDLQSSITTKSTNAEVCQLTQLEWHPSWHPTCTTGAVAVAAGQSGNTLITCTHMHARTHMHTLHTAWHTAGLKSARTVCLSKPEYTCGTYNAAASPHLCAVTVPGLQCGAGPGSWVEVKLRMRKLWHTAAKTKHQLSRSGRE